MDHSVLHNIYILRLISSVVGTMCLYLCDQREVGDKVLVVVYTRTTLTPAGTPLT
jgi:hypothetical protein